MVDHIDGNKLNNCYTNLRWVSQSENVRNWQDKRIERNKVHQFDTNMNLVKTWSSVKEIHEIMGYSKDSIRNCCGGYVKTFRGYIWKYENETRNRFIKRTFDMTQFVSLGEIKGHNFSEYFISFDGETIISQKTQKQMTFFLCQRGYVRVQLSTKISGHTSHHDLYVHKIIHQTLKGGRYDDYIHHIDGNKQNNSLGNIEIIERQDISKKAFGKAVHQIDIKTNTIINTFQCIQDAYRFLNKPSTGQIGAVCSGKRKTAHGFKWIWATTPPTD